MEDRFAVTAATGALGPVLKKLAALLGDEHKLQEGTQRNIMYIKSELDPVHDLLWKLWGMEDLDVACKEWMMEARELSYDMEDGIDGFTLGLERGHSGFIQRETMDGPFKEFMERVKGVSKRCSKMQKIGDVICNRSKLTTDPRALFLHKDASELVGMEKHKKKLINLLQEHEMVCIVGSAGMGKTTLADLVYNTIGDQFQCRAFVSVHPSPNMVEILGTIRNQVTNGATSAGSITEPADQENIIEDISLFLSDKRYLVIIDDIWHWEEWAVIQNAFPRNNMGKIIMTTRINNIALKCHTQGAAYLYTKSFGYPDAKRLSDMILRKSFKRDILETKAKGISTDIVSMCEGMPLAVICLSTAWAESHVQGEYVEWDTWVSHVLMDKFLSTPSLKPLVQSLCLGFDDLSVQLRTCLLFCSIYPPEYEIERDCLARKWVAEGFVSQEEVAEAYIDKLVDRNLLVRDDGEGINIYRVDPLMRALLACKAKEDNFAACQQYSEPGSSSHAKKIRRLSLHMTGHNPDEDVSHTRSLFLGPESQLDAVPFKKLKNLRVLEIDGNKGLLNGHIVDICGLIRLRYLGLNGCRQISELPREIGSLQNLETLDLRWTPISKLPVEIEKLQHLKALHIRGTEITELPKEIVKLQHLRPLNIRGTKVKGLSWEVEKSVLTVVVGNITQPQVVKLPLGSSSGGEEVIISSLEAKCREDLSILVLFNHFGQMCEVLPILMLRVAGRHMKIPHWVKEHLRNVSSLDIRLLKLGEDDLEFLKQMPNLQALELRFEVLPWKPVSITGGGFLKLETFYVDSRMPRVIFDEGAMPELKHLEFKFYTGPASEEDYNMGIRNLPKLQKIVFRCSEYYTSDSPGISKTIEFMRKEATEHPSEITLYVNDMDPMVFERGARWVSSEEKAAIEKRKILFEAAERRRIRPLPRPRGNPYSKRGLIKKQIIRDWVKRPEISFLRFQAFAPSDSPRKWLSRAIPVSSVTNPYNTE